MPSQLTRPDADAKLLATKVAEAQPVRRAQPPEFLAVDREVLRALGPTRASVQAAIQWMCKHERPIVQADVAHWLAVDPGTVSRARDGLTFPMTPYPSDRDGASWLKLNLSEARKHGIVEALVLAQLRAWPEAARRFRGVHWFVSATRGRSAVSSLAAMLEQMVGCCQKTARRALGALEGVFVSLMRVTGRATCVRFLDQREKAPPEPPPLKPSPAEPRPFELRTPSPGALRIAELFGPPK